MALICRSFFCRKWVEFSKAAIITSCLCYLHLCECVWVCVPVCMCVFLCVSCEHVLCAKKEKARGRVIRFQSKWNEMKMEMCVNLWVNNTGGGGLVSLRSEHIGLSFFCFGAWRLCLLLTRRWWPAMGTLNDDLSRNKRSSLGMQVGETSSFTFICLHKHTCEVSVKPQTLRVSRMGSAKELRWETGSWAVLILGLISPICALLAEVCCWRGCPALRSKKKTKKKPHQRYNHWDDILKVCYPWCSTHLQPPLPFLMMYHIRDLSEIGLKMTYWAYLADNIKGYGNGYLSFHQRAFQTF